jgi:hypothetical protein
MTDRLIYLASPYSHSDPAIQEERFKEACMAAAGMMRAGHLVYSPIVHSHPLTHYGLPTDWGYWKRLDGEMLERCDELWVLMLDGWTSSEGVGDEMRMARQRGLPVRYVKLGDLHPIGCVCVECEELMVLEAMRKGGYR